MPPLPRGGLLSRSERKRLKHEKKDFTPGKIRRSFGVVALCLTTIIGGTYEGFMFDQNNLSELTWGNDKASVSTLWDHHDNYAPKTYVYVIPGTGIRDATPTIARPIEPSIATIPNSRFMSLREGSHPQIEDTLFAIYKTIDQEHPPDRIILYGMSAGGKEALTIAAQIRQDLPNTDITIVLSSTPYDQESAYQLQGDYNSLPFIVDLSDNLNLHGGPITRLAIEMYDRRDQCKPDGSFDIQVCMALAHRIAEEKLTTKATSNQLYEWQVEWTRVNSASSDIAALKNVPGGPFTSILYINTTKDTIVDEDEAIPQFAADAKENDIPFTIMKLNDPHASEHQYADNYNDLVLKEYFASIGSIYAGIGMRQRVATEAEAGWDSKLAGLIGEVQQPR